MPYFETRDEGLYRPSYGGIDWYSLRTQHLDRLHLIPGEVWFVNPEEDYEQQVTQENTIIFENAVIPDLDRIDVIDVRDNIPWIFYRDECPDNFEATISQIRTFAFNVATLYPLDKVVEYYLERNIERFES
ncbi:MAG: hypothetical protein KGI25_03555 [Thaumarchaeota archaeon]|nr:hypothetical protein [Nitrososphaerota archaeon]